jgi:hypothetical protein
VPEHLHVDDADQELLETLGNERAVAHALLELRDLMGNDAVLLLRRTDVKKRGRGERWCQKGRARICRIERPYAVCDLS